MRFAAPAAAHASCRKPFVVASAATDATSTLKETLMTALSTESLSTAPSADKQMEVNELIVALSSANDTPEPARSSLLNGKWDVIFAGAPGQGLADSPTRLLALALYAAPLSPSVVAQGLAKLPFNAASLGALSITIVSPEAGQPRVTVETSVSLLGGAPTPLVLRANLQPRSTVALREDFVEVEAFGQRQLLPGPLALSRSLYVVYLDADLLVVRDETGLPSVLTRAEKYGEASEPSYGDDDDAPGAG